VTPERQEERVAETAGYAEECSHCGSSTTWETCWECGGDGFREADEDERFWTEHEEWIRCGWCDGTGGWSVCISSPEWCKANPKEAR
jgi:DnaJ-class molecular chaperone